MGQSFVTPASDTAACSALALWGLGEVGQKLPQGAHKHRLTSWVRAQGSELLAACWAFRQRPRERLTQSSARALVGESPGHVAGRALPRQAGGAPDRDGKREAVSALDVSGWMKSKGSLRSSRWRTP